MSIEFVMFVKLAKTAVRSFQRECISMLIERFRRITGLKQGLLSDFSVYNLLK